LLRFEVDATINLNDQLRISTVEVYDATSQHVLAADLEASKTSATNGFPQAAFSVGGVLAQFASPCSIIGVK